MIQIVNETKHSLSLVLQENNGGKRTRLVIVGNDGKHYTPLCTVDKEFIDDVKQRMGESNKVKIFPNRTTNFFPIYRKGHLTLYPYTKILPADTTVTAIEMGKFSDEAYYHPKTLVVVITEVDDCTFVEVNGKAAGLAEGVIVWPYSRVIGMIGKVLLPISDSSKAEQSQETSVHIQTFSCNIKKWGKIDPPVYLLLPNENRERLRFGEIVIKNSEGVSKTTNALIRCDKSGNEIVRVSKYKKKGRSNGGNSKTK